MTEYIGPIQYTRKGDRFFKAELRVEPSEEVTGSIDLQGFGYNSGNEYDRAILTVDKAKELRDALSKVIEGMES